jgi:hypothetical protein
MLPVLDAVHVPLCFDRRNEPHFPINQRQMRRQHATPDAFVRERLPVHPIEHLMPHRARFAERLHEAAIDRLQHRVEIADDALRDLIDHRCSAATCC